MNRLRSHKLKLNNGIDNVNNNNVSNSNNNNSNNNNNDNGNTNYQNSNPITGYYGLFNKLSKRYSTLSNKIRGRSPKRRSGVTATSSLSCKASQNAKTLCGSYNMTGSHSEDHRLEIGAPILISSTTLDADRFDVSEERLKMIGGGIAATNGGTFMKLKPLRELSNNQLNLTKPLAIQQSSSGSENEDYVDACSSSVTIPANELNDHDQDHHHDHHHDQLNNECNELTFSMPKSLIIHANHDENGVINEKENFDIANDNLTNNIPPPAQFTKCLHRSELKVFLQKSNNNANAITDPMDNTINRNNFDDLDIPKLPELYGSLSISHSNKENDNEVKEAYNENDHDADKENSSPSMIGGGDSNQSKSEPNTPLHDIAEPKMMMNCFLSKQKRYQSAENLIQRKKKKRRSVAFNSTNSINQNNHRNCYHQSHTQFAQSTYMNDSKNSLLSPVITYDDYDLKSVSCQSLNVQSLFVSIDELNEITQQINETDESFNQAIDFEYCLHRDQLKPSERRITLLKNKNTTLIHLMHNKEKLKKSWGDMKHWIGEEGAKLRDVVQRQPLVQRVGSSKLNLNQKDIQCHRRRSPSANGIGVGVGVGVGVNSSTLQTHPDRMGIDDILHPQNVIINSTFSLNRSDIVNEINPNGTHCDHLDDEDIDNNNDNNELLSPLVKKCRQEGQNGFEELRRYVKQGGDFGKELVLILQERIDSEQLYSKSLSKMANKLNKACRELPGSIADAWRSVATEMESRSDIHRQLSASLNDEIVKPLKAIIDSHHKSRKSVESTVDKASRVLAEWRASEAKSKKSSHAAARENEKLQDAMLDVRIQKSPSIALLHQGSNKLAVEKEIKSAEKDCAKLDNKRKKAEEAVKRADVEYYTLCVRAERARVDWEMAVLRGSTLLQTIENQRLINMKNFVSHYTRLTSNMNPIVEGVIQRLQPQVDGCNVIKDMQIVKNIRRNAEGPSEQLLPDFYCEHTTLAMNRERRKHALIKLLQLVKTDLERERRSRNGLKNLSQTLTSQENQNVADKLYHIRSMLTYLEGARFKLQSALLELDHKPRSAHPLAQHIQITRDRTGLQQSVLKVPLWLKNNDKINTNGCNYDDCNEYECISSPNTTTISTSNINCLETSSTSSHSDTILKHFNRSKSNIESLSTHTEIFVNGTAAIVAVPPPPPPPPSQTIATATTIKSLNAKSKTLDPHLHNNHNNHNNNVECTDRGQADGGSNQQDSDFDEFSSQDGDDCDDNGQVLSQESKSNIVKNSPTASALGGVIHQSSTNYYQNTSDIQQNQNQSGNDCYSNIQQSSQCSIQTPSASTSTIVLSRCKALYSYTPKLYDELKLNPGDIIEVHAKQDDGWWLGALHDQIGIFPATYVEEFA